MTSKKYSLQIAICFLLLLVIAYANHFENAFHFDDNHTIVNNPAIRNIKNLPVFFSDPTMFSANPQHHHLRPLVTSTLAIDYWLGGGLYLFFFHLSTFLWHIGLCILLFLVYKTIIGRAIQHRWTILIALLGAATFGLHTAIAETINYVISRSDVISTFFIILSLFLYIRYPDKRKFGLYILAAVAGIFAKETVAVLLILLFFYIIFFEKNLSVGQLFNLRNSKVVLTVIVRLLPLAIAITMVQFYTLTRVNAETQEAGLSNPLLYYWLTQTYVWLRYFIAFFLPIHLTADTDLTVITSLADWRIGLGILFVTGLLILIFKTSKEKAMRPISLGLIWFAASLLPTSVLPFSEVMNDHRMYFAFTGLSFAMVYSIGLFLIRKEKTILSNVNYKRAVGMLVGIFFCLHVYGVHQRNKVWHTEESLWYDVTQKSPGNGRGWMNYGLALMSRGDFNGALKIFNKAEELLPTYNLLAVNLGIVNGILTKHDEAIEYFKKAILLAPNDYNSYSYYARYLAAQKKWDEAMRVAEIGMKLNSNDVISLNAAMVAYQGLGMWGDLERTAQATLNLLPEDSQALQFLQAAKQKRPADTSISNNNSNGNLSATDLINLSLQQYTAGNYEECIMFCNIALKIDPANADAYNNICAAYNMLKEWDKAKDACEKALKLNPDHANAPANLKWAETQDR